MPAQSLLPYVAKAGKWAWESPELREVALRTGVGIGGYLGGKLLGGGETERYQKQLQEQMRLIQEQIRSPGKTPIGQAIQRTIKQQGKQAQQALAASAASRGQTGTSPARASQMQQLGREAEQRAGAMARLSTAAQVDYTNLLGAQERIATEERSAIGDILSFIAKGVAEVATRKLLMEVLKGASTSTAQPADILPPGPASTSDVSTRPEDFITGEPTSTIPQPAPTSSAIPDYTVGEMYEQRQQDRLDVLRGLRSGIQPPTIDATTGATQVEIPYETPRDIATELPRGIPTFEPTGAERVRYPTPLTQRQPSPAMPAYIPPVTEQISTPTEETLRTPAAILPQAPQPVTEEEPAYPVRSMPGEGFPLGYIPLVSPTGTEGITAEALRTPVTRPISEDEAAHSLSAIYDNFTSGRSPGVVMAMDWDAVQEILSRFAGDEEKLVSMLADLIIEQRANRFSDYDKDDPETINAAVQTARAIITAGRRRLETRR